MKIPQSIINKADRIIKNVRQNTQLEQEIMAWITSKGIDMDEEGDVIACLMYAEYEDAEAFAKALSQEMDNGYVI